MGSRPLSRVVSLREQPKILELLNVAGFRNTQDVLEADPITLMLITGLGLHNVHAMVQEISEKLCPPVESAMALYSKSINRLDFSKQGVHTLDMGPPVPRSGASSNISVDDVDKPSHLTSTSTSFMTCMLSTGWKTLDQALRGGLSTGTLTEICGVSGSGKTQLCLQISAHVALQEYIMQTKRSSITNHTQASEHLAIQNSNLAASSTLIASASMTALRNLPQHPSKPVAVRPVIFYDLTNRVPAKRLVEMVRYHWPAVSKACSNGLQNSLQLDTDLEAMLTDSVIIMQPSSLQELMAEVTQHEAAIISNSVRLIVVDGMSALCRKENLHRYSGAAEKAFTGVAAVLKRQAAELGCAGIMTNIEEAVESNQSIASTAVSADHSTMAPSVSVNKSYEHNLFAWQFHNTLGPAWHHVVTTRLVRCPGAQAIRTSHANVSLWPGVDTANRGRLLLVEKCPGAPGAVLPFHISAGGLGG